MTAKLKVMEKVTKSHSIERTQRSMNPVVDKKEDTLCIGFWGYIAVRNIEYGYRHFRLLLMYLGLIKIFCC